MKNPFLPNDLLSSFLFYDEENRGYVTIGDIRDVTDEDEFTKHEENLFRSFGTRKEDGSYFQYYEQFERMMRSLKYDAFICLDAFIHEDRINPSGDPGEKDSWPFWMLANYLTDSDNELHDTEEVYQQAIVPQTWSREGGIWRKV